MQSLIYKNQKNSLSNQLLENINTYDNTRDQEQVEQIQSSNVFYLYIDYTKYSNINVFNKEKK